MKTLGVLICAALVIVGVLSQEARAQTPQQKRAAKQHFEQARRLYDVGRYPEAIEEYQKAYLNVEDPVFLFNIAQSYRLNEQPEEAIRFYKNYIRRSPDAVNRSEVEKRIADLQKEVDDKSRPVQPIIQPTTPTQPPETTTVSPNAPLPTEPPAIVDTGVPAPAATDGANTWRTTGFVLAGVGGVLLVTAVITGALANKAATDLEKATVFDPAIEKRGRAFNGVAIVSGFLGVVAGLAGGYLLMTTSGETTADVATSPRLAVSPVVGREYTGAQASLRF